MKQHHLVVVAHFYNTLQRSQITTRKWALSFLCLNKDSNRVLLMKTIQNFYEVFLCFFFCESCEFADRKRRTPCGRQQEPTCSATRVARDQKHKGEFSPCSAWRRPTYIVLLLLRSRTSFRMSSFRKALKSRQKQHHERSQVTISAFCWLACLLAC